MIGLQSSGRLVDKFCRNVVLFQLSWKGITTKNRFDPTIGLKIPYLNCVFLSLCLWVKALAVFDVTHGFYAKQNVLPRSGRESMPR